MARSLLKKTYFRSWYSYGIWTVSAESGLSTDMVQHGRWRGCLKQWGKTVTNPRMIWLAGDEVLSSTVSSV